MNRPIKRVEFVQKYLDGVFAEDVHAKRVESLANGALGVMAGASLAVSIVGQSLAQARGLLSKHAIKQVDRLLSNQAIVAWDMFAPWVTEVVGARKAIVVAMDWTDFDADDQATLALNLVSNHGRATPLLADRLEGRYSATASVWMSDAIGIRPLRREGTETSECFTFRFCRRIGHFSPQRLP